MIILPIKKKWFDMIKSGEKKEEYREIKRYWITRFNNKGILSKYNPHTIIFRNGYGKNRPSLQCKVNVRVGQGKEKWGAKKRKRVLRFRNFGGARTMTKEQEEAIERLNRFKTIEILYGNTFAMHIEQLKTVQGDIETVLSMLQEQQEENKKKDKIIDLMTEHIVSSAIVDDTVCAIKCDCETDIEEDCTHEKMLNCTKQYFKSKAEKE